MTQVCTHCKELKCISLFEHRKDRPNPRKMCKSCRNLTRDKEKDRARHRERMKERRRAEPEVLRQIYEKCKYGVTKEELGIDKCQICASTKRLSIDHDHKTKKVRGILCSLCNTGLGFFRDNETHLANAIMYLNDTADGVHFQLSKKAYP